MASVFETLSKVNVNDHVEKKSGLTYLSWAWSWAEVKKAYPEAFYTIYENDHGWNYHTDGKTCWVKTGVTIEGIEHIEYLPVMDYRNNSIKLDFVTSFDVNKAIQRSLTKACARHGLGLYIYAGEDLPEVHDAVEAVPQQTLQAVQRGQTLQKAVAAVEKAGIKVVAEPQPKEVVKTEQKAQPTEAVKTQQLPDEAKVKALLIELEEQKTKQDVCAFMKAINGTPEYAVVRPRALQKHQSLKA